MNFPEANGGVTRAGDQPASGKSGRRSVLGGPDVDVPGLCHASFLHATYCLDVDARKLGELPRHHPHRGGTDDVSTLRGRRDTLLCAQYPLHVKRLRDKIYDT